MDRSLLALLWEDDDMSNELKIDLEGISNQQKKLREAIETFAPYSTDFIKNTKDSLNGFNSDFISQIKETLDCMSDTKAPELVDDLNAYSELIEKAIEDFKKLDETYAQEAGRME